MAGRMKHFSMRRSSRSLTPARPWGRTSARYAFGLRATRGKQNPIIDNRDWPDGRTDAVSFTNLMELRFVSLFVMAGVKLRVIRSILDDVKSELPTAHTRSPPTLFSARMVRKYFLEIAKRNGISLLEFGSNNYVMPDVILTSLKDDVRL